MSAKIVCKPLIISIYNAFALSTNGMYLFNTMNLFNSQLTASSKVIKDNKLLEVSTDKAIYASRESVFIRYSVTNNSEQEVYLTINQSRTFWQPESNLIAICLEKLIVQDEEDLDIAFEKIPPQQRVEYTIEYKLSGYRSGSYSIYLSIGYFSETDMKGFYKLQSAQPHERGRYIDDNQATLNVGPIILNVVD